MKKELTDWKNEIVNRIKRREGLSENELAVVKRALSRENKAPDPEPHKELDPILSYILRSNGVRFQITYREIFTIVFPTGIVSLNEIATLSLRVDGIEKISKDDDFVYLNVTEALYHDAREFRRTYADIEENAEIKDEIKDEIKEVGSADNSDDEEKTRLHLEDLDLDWFIKNRVGRNFWAKYECYNLPVENYRNPTLKDMEKYLTQADLTTFRGLGKGSAEKFLEELNKHNVSLRRF